MLEEWKPIFGYESFYEVSNLGRVRSLPRFVNSGRVQGIRKGKVLIPMVNGMNYEQVCLFVNKKRKNTLVHILVASHFLIKADSDLEVNHKDGNPRNNVINNLEWITHKKNMEHAVKTGLFHGRKVVCKTTGNRYLSVSEAARDKGIKVRDLKYWLDNPRLRSKTTLEYITD